MRARRDEDPAGLPPVEIEDLVRARHAIDAGVHVDEAIHECLVDVAMALREDARVAQAASTRSLVLAVPALQVRAVIEGRDFVSSEDLQVLLPFILAHRIDAVAVSGADSLGLARELMAGPLEALARRTLRGPGR